MTKPVLALDVDGVLLNFSGFWVQTAEQALGRNLPLLSRAYHFGVRLGLTKAEYDACWDYFRSIDGWSKVPAFPGVGEVLQQLADRYRLVAVTGIPFDVLDARLANLQALDFPLEEVLATGHRDFSKEQLLRERQAVAFVDDRLKHLQEAGNAGIPRLFWVDQADDQETGDVFLPVQRITHLQELLNFL